MTHREQHLAAQDERNRVALVARHEQDIRHRERQRCALFLIAPYTIEDTDFPGCFHDAAPYPAPINEALL